LRTPCVLPEFDKLKSVSITDERYFTVQFSSDVEMTELRFELLVFFGEIFPEFKLILLRKLIIDGLALNVRRKAGWETREFDPSVIFS